MIIETMQRLLVEWRHELTHVLEGATLHQCEENGAYNVYFEFLQHEIFAAIIIGTEINI